jgi:putative FmdB family regulatory protein
MPIYEYECLECGVHFDRLQRFGAPRPNACPNGHNDVHRILSQPAIIFKGPGFYITDNGRNGKAKSTRKKRQDTESETTSSTKTEKTA